MARSSECTQQYAQKLLDRDPHCQRRDLSPTNKKAHRLSCGRGKAILFAMSRKRLASLLCKLPELQTFLGQSGLV